MTWLAFALAAPLLWAVSTHLDKLLVERYFQGGTIAVFLVYTSLINLLLLGGLLIAFGAQRMAMPTGDVMLLLGSGVAYVLGMYFYLRALQGEDASAVAPFYQAAPLFCCLMGALVLHEHLRPAQWLGIALTIAGAALLSFDFGHARRFKLRLVGWMLAATFLLALSSLVFKIYSGDEQYWPVTFWSYLGQTVVGFLPLLHAPSRHAFIDLCRREPGAMVGLNGANEVVNLVGGLSMRYALTLAPLALVQAVTGATPLFVFALGIALTRWAPQIASEDLTRRTLLLRVLSAAVVVAGVALIGEQAA